MCADSFATGIGVNLPARSRRVAVFLMAGGACGDDATYYRDRTATNIAGGYGAGRFVFVPYCTGDVHVGDDVAPYHWGRVQRIRSRAHRPDRRQRPTAPPTIRG